MLELLKAWLKERFSEEDLAPLPTPRNTPPVARVRPRVAAKSATQTSVAKAPDAAPTGARVDSLGPGKNVLVRNKQVREETSTYESLKILDDSVLDSGEEAGIDPYNTGGFDRSKNWAKRFRN